MGRLPKVQASWGQNWPGSAHPEPQLLPSTPTPAGSEVHSSVPAEGPGKGAHGRGCSRQEDKVEPMSQAVSGGIRASGAPRPSNQLFFVNRTQAGLCLVQGAPEIGLLTRASSSSSSSGCRRRACLGSSSWKMALGFSSSDSLSEGGSLIQASRSRLGCTEGVTWWPGLLCAGPPCTCAISQHQHHRDQARKDAIVPERRQRDGKAGSLGGNSRPGQGPWNLEGPWQAMIVPEDQEQGYNSTRTEWIYVNKQGRVMAT